MKYLLVLAVLAVVVAWMMGRSGRRKVPPPRPPSPSPAPADKPAAIEMLVCSHCKVHMPRDDAQFDLAGRPFCSPEHRDAGPA